MPFSLQGLVFSSSWKTPVRPSGPGGEETHFPQDCSHHLGGVADSLFWNITLWGLCSGPEHSYYAVLAHLLVCVSTEPFEGDDCGSFIYLCVLCAHYSVKHNMEAKHTCAKWANVGTSRDTLSSAGTLGSRSLSSNLEAGTPGCVTQARPVSPYTPFIPHTWPMCAKAERVQPYRVWQVQVGILALPFPKQGTLSKLLYCCLCQFPHL